VAISHAVYPRFRAPAIATAALSYYLWYRPRRTPPKRGNSTGKAPQEALTTACRNRPAYRLLGRRLAPRL